jgi:hypothetical protein
VQSLDTCIIVIVQKDGRRETFNGVAAVGDTAREIFKVHDLFQCHVSGPNFSLTRAERHTLLTLAKPTNRATVLENNATIHTPKVEEREKGAFCNRAADL